MTANRDYFKTVRGVNGINLKKFITFLLGVEPAKYLFDQKEKTFRFYIDSKILESDKAKELKENFENYFGVIICPIIID